MYKDKESSAIAWLGVVFLSPILGPLLYWTIGINRIKRQLGSSQPQALTFKSEQHYLLNPPHDLHDEDLNTAISHCHPPFLTQNSFQALINGDLAFPDMLAAIERAEKSIALSTYIFDSDQIGEQFVAALAKASRRNVTVCVLIDDIGIRYSIKSVDTLLNQAGIDNARFLPRSKGLFRFINLRNHRKLLLIDGKIAYVGGMNIRHGNCLLDKPKAPIQDIHFKIQGPIINQLNHIFQQDWDFSTGEPLRLPAYSEEIDVETSGYARALAHGPDTPNRQLECLLLGALSMAKKSIHIVTPYFLPSSELRTALQVASLRGVQVSVHLPQKNNLPGMMLTMKAYFKQLIKCGIQIYLTAPPFDHSKLMVVDEIWCLIGSSNWDERSMRLNFELNCECINRKLAEQLLAIINAKQINAQEITLDDIERWPLWQWFAARLLRLCAPYL